MALVGSMYSMINGSPVGILELSSRMEGHLTPQSHATAKWSVGQAHRGGKAPLKNLAYPFPGF
jgi:hypothetical protein